MRLETFQERLLWARRHHAKLTQKELAEKMREEYGVEVGHNYISAIETNDEKRPTFEVVRAMAGVMKVSLDWLARFTDDWNIPQTKELEAIYFSPEADEVARLVDTMLPEHRPTILGLARDLAAASARYRRLNEAIEILDSIERKWGKETRLEIERIMRNRGFAIDGAT